MSKIVIACSAAVAFAATGMALAGESQGLFAPGEGVSSVSIRMDLEGMGYQVGLIEAERNCFEATAVNDSGFPIKATYDAATGELLQVRLRDHD